MSNKSNNIIFNTEIYPKIHISSKTIKNSRGLFIINRAVNINLINENQLSPEVIINRSEIYTLVPGPIYTSGTVYISIANNPIKFSTFINNNQPELAGVLGLEFLNINPKKFRL